MTEESLQVTTQKHLTLLGDNFKLLPNALVVSGQPTEVEYDEAFRRLSLIEGATAWWYGDLANARDKGYGGIKEMSERLGIDYNNLRKCASVTSQYELLLRSNNLTFLHHQIAAPLEDRFEWLKQAQENNWSTKELKFEILKSKIEPISFDGPAPKITTQDYHLWLSRQPQCDLLLTDPPYSTDIPEPIEQFANWLPIALDKVKPSGRAYVFIGPYPREVKAYLTSLGNRIDESQLLVWEYRNTMGPSPTHEYKNNWQAIIYYRGSQADKLECPMLLEQYSVQQFSMPDSKNNPYHNTWEKPMELAERFIRHSTEKGDIVLDCFAGTGTFLVAAAKYGRKAFGCDIDDGMVELARKRGCVLE